MKRRQFIKGAVSVAVAASLPGGDGVELYSIAHPVHPDVLTWRDIKLTTEYTYETFAVANRPVEMGQRYAKALARSMMQTKEIVAANVFDRAFGG